jgi:hypothetical protein
MIYYASWQSSALGGHTYTTTYRNKTVILISIKLNIFIVCELPTKSVEQTTFNTGMWECSLLSK